MIKLIKKTADVTENRLLKLQNCSSIVYEPIKSFYLILGILAHTFLNRVHRPNYLFSPKFQITEKLYQHCGIMKLFWSVYL